jgi:hypothetical protein
MSDNTREGWTSGNLERVMRVLPPQEIDCSSWESDIPADQWSNGTLERVIRTLPPQEVDCSDWNATTGEPQLTVSVQFEDGELTDSFVQAIRQSEPNLRLERTPSTTVVLALPNQNAVAALYGAFQGLQAAGCVIGSEQGTFRVRRKAS